ncbi:MAG TPA: family 43 glycosylhydrolase, partial [Polyangiaceae bacterium]|nr:family 43 glycosylhydrolase [Polyangiaceae bacterium]
MRWTQQSPSRAKARTGLTWMFLACPAWFLVGCGQNEQTPNESSVGGSSQATSQSTSAVGGATNKANVGGNASGSSQANSTQGGRGNSAVGSTDQGGSSNASGSQSGENTASGGKIAGSKTGILTGGNSGAGAKPSSSTPEGSGGKATGLGGTKSSTAKVSQGGTPSSNAGGTGSTNQAKGGATGIGGSATPSDTDLIANFKNGGYLNDSSGKRIEAHGGGFLYEDGTWYWFGEDKSQNSGNFKAVNCYSSTNLTDWTFRRAIITRSTASVLNTADRIVERPKVIYNENTQQYVMWLHWEGQNYAEAKAGVFSSSTIDGNYTYQSAFRPNNNMSRDDTLFKDDDGKAYFISAANENADLVLYELSEDYLTVKRQVAVLWAGAKREAPAMFKHDGRYYLITSACTGWDPNQAQYATATSIGGPWSSRTNIGNSTTYDTQSTFVIPIRGSQATTYVYVGDRWQDPDLVSSKYIFLPLKPSGTSLSLDYYDAWQLNLTTGVWSVNDGYLPQSGWKVLYVDSEETVAENGRATRAFDDSGQT